MSSEMQLKLAEAMRRQIQECDQSGSALYTFLLARAADDVESGGPCWELLAEESGQPRRVNPALRLMGAMHRLVLAGAAPDLAAFYPSANGRLPSDDAGWEHLWSVFHATITRHRDDLYHLVRRPIQTNEVGRSAMLAGGFLTAARETGLPLRILELGASAGLNLRWDRYRYEAGDLAWGDRASPLRFRGAYAKGVPPLDTKAHIAERAACDQAPLDATNADDRLTLLSYIWADQIARIQRLRAALALAASAPVRIDAAHAPDWLEAQVAEPRPGLATVVFHSVFIIYLVPEDRARLVARLNEAGARATSDAPFAWLRMEADAHRATEASLRLTLWPGGEERLLAHSGFHGQDIHWL